MTAANKPPFKEYLGDGVTVGFAAEFRFNAPSHIHVRLIEADGGFADLAYGADYSVTGGGTDAGGTVTMIAAPPTGSRLQIRRITPRNQSMNYTTSDTFPAESHEDALDKAMLVDQEQDVAIEDMAARALMVPIGEMASVMPSASVRAGKFLGFAVGGAPVALPGTGADEGLREALASEVGGDLVGWRGPGTNRALRSDGERAEDQVSIFEWEGSGADDTVRFERAFAGIGSRTLLIPAGTYGINGILDVMHDGMTLRLQAGAVLQCDVGLLGVDFTQENFGSAIRIRDKHDVAIFGENPLSSVIRMVNGTQGNAITFINSMRGYVRDLQLVSDYTEVEAFTDDSFGTGLFVIGYNPPLTEICNAVAEGVHVRGFLHYGMQAYGDMASLKIYRPDISDIGDPDQALSVGGGVAFTRGTKDCGVFGGTIHHTKLHGFFQASAGLPSVGSWCRDVYIHHCGGSGIHATEEEQWGVDPGNAGTTKVDYNHNHIHDTTGPGIRMGTFDGASAIGPLKDFRLTHNFIHDCAGGGILCQSVDVSGKRLEDGLLASNRIEDCGTTGIGIVAAARNIVIDATNIVDGHTVDIDDLQELWTPVTFEPGFSNSFPAPFPQTEYRREGQDVYLRTAINGSAGGHAFVVPPELLPANHVLAEDARCYLDCTNGRFLINVDPQPFIYNMRWRIGQ